LAAPAALAATAAPDLTSSRSALADTERGSAAAGRPSLRGRREGESRRERGGLADGVLGSAGGVRWPGAPPPLRCITLRRYPTLL